MRITVCRLQNGRDEFAADWDRLVKHVRAQGSAIVLLPEMPFFPWFPGAHHFDAGTWSAAVSAHDEWQTRLSELEPAVALGTRPVNFGDVRYNTGFWWNANEGIIESIHAKSRLWSEKGAWETSWYEAAPPDFEVAIVNGVSIGMLIGPELWMPDQAKLYGEDGAQVIAVPRVDYSPDADLNATDNAWLGGGHRTAQASGAYCISSTRITHGGALGGAGWIIAPNGRVLAITSANDPIVTADVAITPDVASLRDAAPWNRP
jgi:N-carbamoylputrescine amidase